MLSIIVFITVFATQKDLFAASRNGDTRKMNTIISNGIDIDTTDDEGNTVLIHAARKAISVDFLIKNGANLFKKNIHGKNALELSTEGCLNGLSRSFKLIASAMMKRAGYVEGINSPDENERYSTLLSDCLSEGDLESVKFLLDMAADVNIPDAYMYYPLHLASIYMDSETVSRILRLTSNPNVISKPPFDENGGTALDHVFRFGPKNPHQYEIIKILRSGGVKTLSELQN